MNPQKTGLLSLYFGIFLMSLTGLFAKSIPLDATSITQLRSVVAIVALFLFCTLRGTSIRLKSFKETLGIYGLGVFMAIHWVTYFHAMQVSTVAIGMLSLFSYPVITVLLEPLFQKKLPAKADLIAGAVSFTGVIVLTMDGANGLSGAPLVGAAWGIFSAFVFSLRNIIQKYTYPEVPSGTLMFHQVVATAVILTPFVSFTHFTSLTWDSWALIIALGVLCSSAAHTLLALSLKRLPAKSVAQISCLQPVLGALLAWAFLKEVVAPQVLAGGALILAVAVWESYKQSYKPRAVS